MVLIPYKRYQMLLQSNNIDHRNDTTYKTLDTGNGFNHKPPNTENHITTHKQNKTPPPGEPVIETPGYQSAVGKDMNTRTEANNRDDWSNLWEST